MSRCVLGIDPGSTESAWAAIDPADCKPVWIGKASNSFVRGVLEIAHGTPTTVAIEQIGHYGTGMPAGKTVFDTCRAIGRFEQICDPDDDGSVLLVPRLAVKLHFCRSATGTDANVAQALVDRFAPDEGNHGKGTKANPGWFHGFKADIWQAYALAVYVADQTALAAYVADQGAKVVLREPRAVL